MYPNRRHLHLFWVDVGRESGRGGRDDMMVVSTLHGMHGVNMSHNLERRACTITCHHPTSTVWGTSDQKVDTMVVSTLHGVHGVMSALATDVAGSKPTELGVPLLSRFPLGCAGWGTVLRWRLNEDVSRRTRDIMGDPPVMQTNNTDALKGVLHWRRWRELECRHEAGVLYEKRSTERWYSRTWAQRREVFRGVICCVILRMSTQGPRVGVVGVLHIPDVYLTRLYGYRTFTALRSKSKFSPVAVSRDERECKNLQVSGQWRKNDLEPGGPGAVYVTSAVTITCRLSARNFTSPKKRL
ncbi:hypothetical protein DFH09DRAFT_1102058 [Mycena vulgaris]|nr:hypothetical protein DFH09DRAFT_1102058 [Mycena vulgaris]